jgi:hypothetical protein
MLACGALEAVNGCVLVGPEQADNTNTKEIRVRCVISKIINNYQYKTKGYSLAAVWNLLSIRAAE